MGKYSSNVVKSMPRLGLEYLALSWLFWFLSFICCQPTNEALKLEFKPRYLSNYINGLCYQQRWLKICLKITSSNVMRWVKTGTFCPWRGTQLDYILDEIHLNNSSSIDIIYKFRCMNTFIALGHGLWLTIR